MVFPSSSLVDLLLNIHSGAVAPDLNRRFREWHSHVLTLYDHRLVLMLNEAGFEPANDAIPLGFSPAYIAERYYPR